MRSLLLTVLLGATAFGAPASERAARREIENVATFARLFGVVRYFYPSDAAADLDWDRFAVHGVKSVRAAGDAKRLETVLESLFSPLGPGIEIGSTLPSRSDVATPDSSLIAWRYLGAAVGTSNVFSVYKRKRTHRPATEITRTPGQAPSAPVSNAELFDSVLTTGAHASVNLGSGLRARVPLALSDAEANASQTDSGTMRRLRAAIDQVVPATDLPDADTRLADVVVAWNVFRHFYPYWTESAVDWDGRLRPQLELAFAANSREAHRNALWRLIADARDGHGRVVDERRRQARGALPIQFGVIDTRLVVTGTGVPEHVPVGAVVSKINGIPAAERLLEAMERASGTAQWKQARGLREIATCEKDAVINLAVDSGTGPVLRALRCVETQPPAEKRPAAIAELISGVWYVDLTRAPMTDVRPVLEKLARAAGVVFDVRGYPTDAGAQILPHLIDAPEDDRWMHVPKIIGPFAQNAGWQSLGWNLKPAAPHLAGRIAFLTDGRAISYAESVMGYVADRKLGTIVGSTTAGTNGNVAAFPVPGGFTISFTGMRVTRHDGHTPHHLVGVKPDVSIVPTLRGLRDGRDEVLERALALIRGK